MPMIAYRYAALALPVGVASDVATKASPAQFDQPPWRRRSGAVSVPKIFVFSCDFDPSGGQKGAQGQRVGRVNATLHVGGISGAESTGLATKEDAGGQAQ